ncbi:MAG: hypothetical protein VXZ05_10335 [Pseudomonadota bacterium]|jgi:hypothetical protein|nr:hypothetical protein [Pseudomonadota bacterium]
MKPLLFVWLLLAGSSAVFGVVAHVSAAPAESSDFTRADDPLPQAYKMPIWVDAVARVCPWKSPSAEGYIRVIRREHGDGSHGLYIQWVRSGIAGAETAPVSTLAVKELEGEYMVRLTMPEETLARDACLLTSLGEDMINERRFRFDFLLHGPGEMQVRVTRMLDGGV